jgi:hypothetical protein
MNKQYRLIKKYPGSPELNMEVIKKETGYNRVDKTIPLKNWIIPLDIENYTEFWEEIKEKDYEILSFLIQLEGSMGSSIFKVKNNKIDLCAYTVEECLIKNFEIYSVKRLFDGKVFIINDKLDGFDISCGTNSNISSFRIENNELKVGVREIGVVSLKSCKHKKQPLFTTEDGVDIFKGDNYFSINKKYWLVESPENTCKLNYETYHINSHNFSTKEKAEEYILYNKPCVSLNDIIKCHKYPEERGINFYSRCAILIKQKIKSNE